MLKMKWKNICKGIAILLILVPLSSSLFGCSKQDSNTKDKETASTEKPANPRTYKDIWFTDDSGVYIGVIKEDYLYKDGLKISAYYNNTKYKNCAYQIQGINIDGKYYPYSYNGQAYDQHTITDFDEKNNLQNISFSRFNGLKTIDLKTVKSIALSVKIFDDKFKANNYMVPIYPESDWKSNDKNWKPQN